MQQHARLSPEVQGRREKLVREFWPLWDEVRFDGGADVE